MFGRKKLNSKRIHITWDGNKPRYHALLCISLFLGGKKESNREFTKKDLRLVGSIKLRIEREKMTWWEIKEEPGAFYLYYYPDIYLEATKIRDKELHKDVPGWGEHGEVLAQKDITQSLEGIAEMFNAMVN